MVLAVVTPVLDQLNEFDTFPHGSRGFISQCTSGKKKTLAKENNLFWFFSATKMQISWDVTLSLIVPISFYAFLFQTPAVGKDKPQAGPSKSPSVAEIRNKLLAAAKEVRPSASFTERLTPGLNRAIQHPPSPCTLPFVPD